jgi:hypothetical protein
VYLYNELVKKRTLLSLSPIQSASFKSLNMIFKNGGRIKENLQSSSTKLLKET